eukprot:TRINITY_DN31290_c0_g1_i1.p1 TRINITY_DN31290_c0_g1~~TRINITY_DN31290_c0_g1_i1.p1  ORF type:complete len:314 (+),score=46.69 TRINITY_DN31290_c0_g1_i1:47-943(+)
MADKPLFELLTASEAAWQTMILVSFCTCPVLLAIARLSAVLGLAFAAVFAVAITSLAGRGRDITLGCLRIGALCQNARLILVALWFAQSFGLSLTDIAGNEEFRDAIQRTLHRAARSEKSSSVLAASRIAVALNRAVGRGSPHVDVHDKGSVPASDVVAEVGAVHADNTPLPCLTADVLERDGAWDAAESSDISPTVSVEAAARCSQGVNVGRGDIAATGVEALVSASPRCVALDVSWVVCHPAGAYGAAHPQLHSAIDVGACGLGELQEAMIRAMSWGLGDLDDESPTLCVQIPKDG